MGFFSKVVKAVASPIQSVTNSLGGGDSGAAILSGIPYLGQGFAAQQKNAFEAQQSAKQMSFQERMANTAHQRQVADLKKAGINPMLSRMSGAAVPSGAMASGTAGSGADSSARMVETMFKKENKKAEAIIAKDKSATELNKQAKKVQQQQEEVLKNSAKDIKATTQIKNYRMQGEKVEADFQRDYGKYHKNANAIADIISKMLGSARGASQILGPMGKGRKPIPKTKKREKFGPQGEHRETTYEHLY